MSNLKTYLAEKYMSGPKADAILSRAGPPKKKRRKVQEVTANPPGGLRIRDAEEIALGQETVYRDEVSANPPGGSMIHDAEEIALAQETVYRDSSGKQIDTKAARAEAARLKRLREDKEAQKMEWGKGLVQKDEAEKRRQELEKQRGTAFARHADDKDLNEELKAKKLWNDPAAAFLTKKKSKGPRKPEYKGPAPPNRFGIKPGYRWDGVEETALKRSYSKAKIQESEKEQKAINGVWTICEVQKDVLDDEGFVLDV